MKSRNSRKNVKPTPKSSIPEDKIKICLKSLILEFVNSGLGLQEKDHQN
jgi:hypothetical protein